ncbi:MAG: kelch repeat-containing protein [Trueperaceae bacterium]
MPRPLAIILLITLALFGSATILYAQTPGLGESEARWRRMAPMPTARSEMPAAVLQGVIYVPGGLGAFGRALTVFEAFDPGSNSWRTLESLPQPLHHTGAAATGGRIYVAGGYTDSFFRLDNSRAWSYEPAQDEWERIADMPAPRAAHALVALDGLIYAVGGVGPRSDELWAFDPDANVWTSDLAPLPTPREHLTAAVSGGQIYAIGGRTSGGNLATVEVYDPSEDRWTLRPKMPTARSGLSGATVAGLIHVAGGEELQGGGTFETHEILDPKTGEWSAGVPLSEPRHGLATAAVGGSWYVIGGATRAGAQTVASLTDAVDALEAEQGERQSE